MKAVSCRTVKKFRLLLLDANVVTEMARHSLWGQVIGLCEVHLARTVIARIHTAVPCGMDEERVSGRASGVVNLGLAMSYLGRGGGK